MPKKNGRQASSKRVKISSKIPVPKSGPATGHKSLYPFRALKVGQSFNYLGPVRNAYNLCSYYSKKLKRDFVARQTDKGPRCWRVG